MGDKSSDLVQGTLDMLVLKTLALEPMHGYGITVRIEQMSRGVFHLKSGLLISCNPEVRAGWVNQGRMEADREQQASKILRPDGEARKRLNNETQEWGRQAAAIARILEAS